MDNPDHDSYLEMDSASGDAMNDQHKRRRHAPKPVADETLDRTRRIETRLTQFMIAMGVRTDAQKPEFRAPTNTGQLATLQLPSPHSTMKEVIDNIPEEWHEPVAVYVKDQRVAVVRRP